MNDIVSDKIKIFDDKKDGYKVYKLKEKNQSNYYYIDNKTCNLVRIENSSGIFRKVIIELDDYTDGFPDKINITHLNIKLNIKLKLIER